MKFTGIDIYSQKAEEITIEKGKIIAINEIKSQKGLPYLSKTFLDMQVNGYKGIDYSGQDLDADGIAKLVEALSETGTCRHVPTIITNSRERITNNLKIIADTVRNNEMTRNAIPGIHVEGPFISSEDGPRGAHDPQFVRNPDTKEFDEWLDASDGLLKIVTIAPEKEGAIDFIKYAVNHNVTVSIGHCAPDAKDIKKALDAGATLSTHLGNGSHAILPRLRNYIWQQLAEDGLCAGIISDGFHLPDSVLKTFWRTKGKDRLILVSDVALLGGKEPGIFKWGNIDVEVFPDGHLGLPGTALLAGAGHLLDRDIPVFMKATGAGLKEAIGLVTTNPEKMLKLEPSTTGFHVGDIADIVSFTYDDLKLNMKSISFKSFIRELNDERNQ